MDRRQVESEVVNKTTIRTKFDPHQVGHFDVRCQLTINKEDDDIGNKNEIEIDDLKNEDKDALTQKGICPQRVHVGCKYTGRFRKSVPLSFLHPF